MRPQHSADTLLQQRTYNSKLPEAVDYSKKLGYADWTTFPLPSSMQPVSSIARTSLSKNTLTCMEGHGNSGAGI